MQAFAWYVDPFCDVLCVYIPTSPDSHMQPRLAIWLILNARENAFFALFATCCSSWVHINSGTSRRSLLLPEGHTELDYILNSNCMVSRIFGLYTFFWQPMGYMFQWSGMLLHACRHMQQDCLTPTPKETVTSSHEACLLRTVLLFLLIVARGGTFLLEQPASSMMRHFHRMEWLSRTIKVPRW